MILLRIYRIFRTHVYCAFYVINVKLIRVDALKIGKNIREIRRGKRIKQIVIAGSSGISNTYLSDIENGRAIPSLKVLIRIAHSLDTDISDLLK